MVTKKCPKNSIFYYAIQCCVSISDFPCKTNCIREYNNAKNDLKENGQGLLELRHTLINEIHSLKAENDLLKDDVFSLRDEK